MKYIKYKIIFIIIFISSTSMINDNNNFVIDNNHYKTLLYDNIWGTIYNPTKEQCKDNPRITGDGSRIDVKNASKLRWIAISQEMLDCEYRRRLIKNNKLYNGKIKYGDTIIIESDNEKINGWWVVHDAKNVRYTNSIDFLQTKGDKSLYNNNKLWSGKFNNIKIFKLSSGFYKNYKNI